MDQLPFDIYTKPYCLLDFTSWLECFYRISADEDKRIAPNGSDSVRIHSTSRRVPPPTLINRLGRLCSKLSGQHTVRKPGKEKSDGILGQYIRAAPSVPQTTVTIHSIDIEDGSHLDHVISHFFEWTGGEVNHIHTLTADSFYEICEEKSAVQRISSIFAGRPIKTKMLTQRLRQNDFNSPLNIFMREYVDFTMYTADDRLNRLNGYPSKAMTITPKLLNCEFLIFHNLLRNAEVLRDEYKGWGLLLNLPDPKLGFDFYLQNFQKWYSGEEAKLKYLMLACDFSPDEWSRLCSLGEEDIKPYGTRRVGTIYTFKEFRITRNDGEICHIGVMEEKKIYFYLGEKTEGILRFMCDTYLTNV